MKSVNAGTLTNSDWFVIPSPNANATMRLVCFPYAGGSAAYYQSWVKRLPEFVELVIVQPPGRASRLLEPAISTMPEMMKALLPFERELTEKPYVLLGHSLGSRIAFQFAIEVIQSGGTPPLHFIASGSRAPHTPKLSERICDLPDDVFLEKIEAMNGTPVEVMQNKELMSLLLPMLKADFTIADNYIAAKEALPCSITAFSGDSDTQVTKEQLISWSDLTTRDFNYAYFDGGHFFINTDYKNVTNLVSEILEKTHF